HGLPDVDLGARGAEASHEWALLVAQHERREAPPIEVPDEVEERLMGAAGGPVLVQLDEEDPRRAHRAGVASRASDASGSIAADGAATGCDADVVRGVPPSPRSSADRPPVM